MAAAPACGADHARVRRIPHSPDAWTVTRTAGAVAPLARRVHHAAIMELHHILVPVDFSEFSTRALSHGAALARWYDAKLTVLHVIPPIQTLPVVGELGAPVYLTEPPSEAGALDALRQLFDDADVPANTTPMTRLGDPPTTVVATARELGADLIVMGTHGRRGFTRLLLGSVTERVLREAPCPVLTVPPHERAGSSEVVTFKRIVVPIDFSEPAKLALQVALDLARQADGAVTLLHAIEWLAEDQPRSRTNFNVAGYRGHLADDAKARLDALVASESELWVTIETEVVFGRAHRAILRAVDARQADLIVIGVEGRGAVDLALFGSTTQQVVRGASCPVLTVRKRTG